jgi:hypothetical protein
MRPAKPQDGEVGDTEKQDGRDHADHDRCVVSVVQQRGKNVMSGGDDPRDQRHCARDCDQACEDRADDRAAYPGASCLAFRERVAEYEQREPGMPDHEDPERGLRTSPEQAGRRKQAGKSQRMDNRRGRGDQIAA